MNETQRINSAFEAEDLLRVAKELHITLTQKTSGDITVLIAHV